MLTLILAIALVLSLAYIFHLLRKMRRMVKRALEQSRRTILGQVVEQLTPITSFFPYNPKDARFIGSPIDFIVFDGISEGELKRIVFVEVKSGRSKLSKKEKMVKEIVGRGRVEFATIKIPT